MMVIWSPILDYFFLLSPHHREVPQRKFVVSGTTFEFLLSPHHRGSPSTVRGTGWQLALFDTTGGFCTVCGVPAVAADAHQQVNARWGRTPERPWPLARGR